MCQKSSAADLFYLEAWGELTLAHIHVHHICSRRLWTHLIKKHEKAIYIWRFTYLHKFKTLWQREILLVYSNFYFCHNVFKSRPLQRRQKATIWWKGLTASILEWPASVHDFNSFTAEFRKVDPSILIFSPPIYYFISHVHLYGLIDKTLYLSCKQCIFQERQFASWFCIVCKRH